MIGEFLLLRVTAIHVDRRILRRFHITCVKLRAAQVEVIGKCCETRTNRGFGADRRSWSIDYL
jgi:hypothetical protein